MVMHYCLGVEFFDKVSKKQKINLRAYFQETTSENKLLIFKTDTVCGTLKQITELTSEQIEEWRTVKQWEASVPKKITPIAHSFKEHKVRRNLNPFRNFLYFLDSQLLYPTVI